jgi:nucleotide-binding universal stress UspA family protein
LLQVALSGSPHVVAPVSTASSNRCIGAIVILIRLMGSDGDTGLIGTLFGSETTKVMIHSPIPVLIYRHRLAT